MAIVKATYTKSKAGAKAAIRYIQHRPGRDGEKATRELFGSDGVLDRQEAYRMIDAAEKGSVFSALSLVQTPRQRIQRGTCCSARSQHRPCLR
jgi:hypothetical protein